MLCALRACDAWDGDVCCRSVGDRLHSARQKTPDFASLIRLALECPVRCPRHRAPLPDAVAVDICGAGIRGAELAHLTGSQCAPDMHVSAVRLLTRGGRRKGRRMRRSKSNHSKGGQVQRAARAEGQPLPKFATWRRRAKGRAPPHKLLDSYWGLCLNISLLLPLVRGGAGISHSRSARSDASRSATSRVISLVSPTEWAACRKGEPGSRLHRTLLTPPPSAWRTHTSPCCAPPSNSRYGGFFLVISLVCTHDVRLGVQAPHFSELVSCFSDCATHPLACSRISFLLNFVPLISLSLSLSPLCP